MSQKAKWSEMEMRACEDMGMSEDLTPPIPTIAASLHEPFLRTHCSSCFHPITQQPQPDPPAENPTSCPACNHSLSYCSRRCSHADSHRHGSSGECRLLRGPSASRPGDTADLRAALRLLNSLERLGLLPAPHPPPGAGPPPPPPRRLGGLLAGGGLEDLLGCGGEMAERIREEGLLMSRARGADRGRGGGASLEEAALWAVLTNAVEVQVSDEGALGIAVYGPRFSWFNHSCSPNACFRFQLSSRSEPTLGSSDPGLPRVLPAGTEGTAAAAWEEWNHGESVCHYGPRIVVRSIKPIAKGEEVCITYTDLLKPKAARKMEVDVQISETAQAARHLDLWLKYQFVCCCERCDASPQKYIDYILSCNDRNPNSDQSNMFDPDCEELAECLDQAIARYMSDGNPEACCEKLESILFGSFQDEEFQLEEAPRRKRKLQPLHHLSLDAYIALASAYRIRAASNLSSTASSKEELLEAFKMRRAAAAYSLLLAGAMHHLLSSDSSLIPCAALFCTSAGESILALVRSSVWGSTSSTNRSEFCLASDLSQWTIREGSVSWDEFNAASMRFLECLSSTLLKLWPFLVRGLPYLESIRSPVNFSWLGIASGGLSATKNGDKLCVECDHTARTLIEEDRCSLLQLAVHCLLYGRYLATICYGSQSYLAERANNLLCGV